MSRQHTLHSIRTLWPILFGLGVMLLLLSGCGGGAQPKVYHVGILSGGDAFAQITVGFKAKMTELGYIEGKNIVYDTPKATSDKAEQLRIAQKFVADKVDLIFAFATDPARAAKTATQGTSIPVVFGGASVEGTNLINNVLEPGGNITGVRSPGPEQTLKRFEILQELVPQAKRIYVPYDPSSPNAAPNLVPLRQKVAPTGAMLVEVPCSNVAQLQADLQARAKAADMGIDAILNIPTSLTSLPGVLDTLRKFATDHKLPVAGSESYPVESGALFDVGANRTEAGQLAAPLADKILKGVPAGTIPVVSGDLVLRINYKVAQQLGLSVPEGLMKQAVTILR